MPTEIRTPIARLAPASSEAHGASVPSAAFTTILTMLPADPARTVTEWTAGGRLVQVELLYHPSDVAFTLCPSQRDHAQTVGAGP